VESHRRNPRGICFGYKTHHIASHTYPTNIKGQSFLVKHVTLSTLLLEILLHYSLLLAGSLKASQLISSKFYQLHLSQTLTSAEHLRFQEVFAAVPEQKAFSLSSTITHIPLRPSSGIIKKIVHAF